ncbi:MAG: FAD-binding oxidoreductase [Gammaproteobacteria bacterium]|nr:FAD-binding oxidoreductase [Gammaproteobacteria bacterium]
MNLSGWGNYPQIDSESIGLDKKQALLDWIDDKDEVIAFGNGRSYGDSALSQHVVLCRPHNYFLGFDEVSGLLHVQAGVLLSEILEVFVKRGWFLEVTPGTRLITVGGAIASDVHGKNHHQAGCFSNSVKSFQLMLPDGKIVNCSQSENHELFNATCGGMGLTGIILDAEISLTKINSAFIDQQTIKTANLRETFEAFEKYQDVTYSVAWMDCLARGDNLGRGLLMVGEFCDDGNLYYQVKRKPGVPFSFPGFALNSWSIRAFNALYYGRASASRQKVDIESFFYPLDAIADWNRIYGRKGFVQYQFVLPRASSFEGLREILKVISDEGKGSFLAVLKLCGAENENLLSFPLEGYSLALDFKIEPGVFDLINLLDQRVLHHGGRIYLAKDARVSQAVFEKGYASVDQFRDIRQHYKMNHKFNSLQSRRVGI